MQEISSLVSFGAGLLSFFSPCILPLIPVFFASLAGTSASHNGGHRSVLVFHAFSFVMGFTVLFTLLGAGAGLLGLAVSQHLVLIRQLAGSLMVLMGVFILLALKIPWLNFSVLPGRSSSGKTGYWRSFITGSLFAAGWTPCVGPILGSILAMAMGTGTALEGAYLLMIYSLGLGLPFIIAGIAFDALKPYLMRLQPYTALLHLFSGLLLITIGVLILLDKLVLLSVSV